MVEQAAIAASSYTGRGLEGEADDAAVDAMRRSFDGIPFDGEVVIGEGERDNAPMLFIGEKVGTGKGPAPDLAVDPLEGTTLTAKWRAGAMSTMALGIKGSILRAPDIYMDKIAVGPGYPIGVIDLDKSPSQNLITLADAKECGPAELVVCMLDRPRHRKLITEVRDVGARIILISDGDVSGVIATGR